MGARDRIDTVELNKAQAVDQTRKIGTLARSRRRLGQGVPVEEQVAGGAVVDPWKSHRVTGVSAYRHS